MPDAGDRVTAQLLVEPHDATTTAVLTVHAPDGATHQPVVTTPDGGRTWTAPITYTTAGVWTLAWEVAGTGASVERQRVGVAPYPLASDDGRTYATSTDLAVVLGAAPPLDADRLLRDASRLLEAEVLRQCRYDVDPAGMPTHPQLRNALREAVCAQVQWWEEIGDSIGAGGAGWSEVEIGTARLKRSNDTASGQDAPARQLAPRALDALRAPDLTPEIFQLGAVSVL